MPGGLGDPVQGILIFTGIKLVGYTCAGLYLNRSYPDSKANIFAVGFLRTIIGIAFGTALAMFSFPFLFVGGLGFLIYFFGLIPVRLLEWFIIIKIFYDRELGDRPKMWQNLAFGTGWSFLLDIPALAGFSFFGDFWIC